MSRPVGPPAFRQKGLYEIVKFDTLPPGSRLGIKAPLFPKKASFRGSAHQKVQAGNGDETGPPAGPPGTTEPPPACPMPLG